MMRTTLLLHPPQRGTTKSFLIRGIASATLPCLSAAKRRGRKDWTRGKNLRSILDPAQSYRQKRIQQLTQKMENTEPAKMARVVLDCPYIKEEELIDEDTFDRKIIHLYTDLDEWMHSKVDNVDKEWLSTDVDLILSGALSNRELMQNISDLVDKIVNATDRNKVENLLGWYMKTTVQNFQQRFLNTFKSLSNETRSILKDIKVVPLEDYRSTKQRIDEIKLAVLDPWHRKEFYRRKTDLFRRMQKGPFGRGAGTSMLPTIPDQSFYYAQPLHPTPDVNLLQDEIQVGNVVSFVSHLKSGDIKFLSKRVTGLPGDRVKMITGETVIVPEGTFWAVGDNAAMSHDSRHFGAVPEQNLRSKLIFTYRRFPSFFRWL